MYQAFGLQSSAKRPKFIMNFVPCHTCVPRAKRNMATKPNQSDRTSVAMWVSTNQRSVFPHGIVRPDHTSAILCKSFKAEVYAGIFKEKFSKLLTFTLRLISLRPCLPFVVEGLVHSSVRLPRIMQINRRFKIYNNNALKKAYPDHGRRNSLIRKLLEPFSD